ncbi:succinate-acetate transporter protein [Desulfuromonas soudanensis]|uniref:Succinate-acetate transporter protein n=1 Tax=Desulfuromonas soudanensis TaxID=1603606 RepID=A0A0M4D336_9BACT|nr:GPR1/FUN34/YaaH family transporter [Desulfuromonas soudanensis]ALC17802.1 succinate-acetate transporter protein [Desulfuromonas soudanensis]
MTADNAPPVISSAPGENAAPPAPLGLLTLGLTTILLGLGKSGLVAIDNQVLAFAIFYAGLFQVIVGISEHKRQKSFGAIAFTSLGLFWLSLLALTIFPALGWGGEPKAANMVAYLTMWGLFAAILFLATFRLNRVLQGVFGSLMAFFLLLAMAASSGNPVFTLFAGYAGMICGSLALYAGVAQRLNERAGRTVAPLGTWKGATRPADRPL